MASEPFPQPGSTPEPHFGAAGDPVVPTPLPHATGGIPVGPPVATASATMTDSGLTQNLAAPIAVLFPPFTSLIFLFLEKRNAFVRFWAMQGTIFGCVIIAFVVFSFVVGTVLAHILGLLAWLWFLVARLVNLVFFVGWLVMLFKAFSGQEWEAPVIGQLARQQLPRGPLV